MNFDANKLDKPILPKGIEGGFSTIIADPPTPIYQKGNYGAHKHYELMEMEQIKAMPVGDLAAPNAHCWLWTTNAAMEESFKIMREWGFTPRSIFTWVRPKLGLGVYLRTSSEHCILGTRGKAPVRFKAQMNWGFFPVQDHSHKPEEFYDIVERVSPGPYLELFARRRRHGWAAWGNETPGGGDVMIPGYPIPEYSDAVKEEFRKRQAEKGVK